MMKSDKKMTFTSKMASKNEMTIEVTVSLRSTGKDFTKEELETLSAFEVDDYMKSDMVKAVQDKIYSGGDKAVVNGVKLQIEWQAFE